MEKNAKGFCKMLTAAAGFLLLLAVFFPCLHSPLSATPVKAEKNQQEPVQPAAAALREAPESKMAAAALDEVLLWGLQVEVKVSNQGAEPSRNITLEIPLLAGLDSPYQVLLDERFSHAPLSLNDWDFASRSMTVELPTLAPGESEVVIMDYTLLSAIGDDGASLLEGGAVHDLREFLEPSPKVESDHSGIKGKARQLTEGLGSGREKAQALYAFVIEHLRYDAGSPHRNTGALAALRHGEGVCEEYASLFTALCRAAGIPARVVNGYTDPAGTGDVFRLDEGESLSLRGYRHAWAEFYLEDEGWLFADPAFEQSSSQLRYFGRPPQASHIAQNYMDRSIRGSFRGGQLTVSWEEQLVGH